MKGGDRATPWQAQHGSEARSCLGGAVLIDVRDRRHGTVGRGAREAAWVRGASIGAQGQRSGVGMG